MHRERFLREILKECEYECIDRVGTWDDGVQVSPRVAIRNVARL